MTAYSERSLTRVPVPSRALAYLPTTAFVIDALVVFGAVSLGAISRERLSWFGGSADVSGSLMVAGPLMVAGWLLTIFVMGGHNDRYFGAGTDEYKRVMNATLLAVGLVGVGCYLAKFPLSRGYFVLAFAIGLPMLLVGRYVLRKIVQRARVHGALRHTVVIAGSSDHIDEVAQVLRREAWLGYQVIGALTPAYETAEETRAGIPVLGNTEDATSVVLMSGADIIFFAGGGISSGHQMRRIAWDLELEDVQVVVAPSVTDVSGERIRVRPVGGLPLIHIDSPRATDASRWGKRLFDLVGSIGLLVLLAPVMAAVALRIKTHDRGDVLFRQTRVGRDGQMFSCLKFRTMVPDAEARLAQLHTDNGYVGGLFKLKDDPRITNPGRSLRRFSLDELPQLINVVRGDMSLVGPRPPLPHEVKTYARDTERRLRVRPGVTGLWQVSGRSDLSWDETVRLDLYYVDNWSMLQDLSILTKTLGAVIRSRGAY